MDLKTFIHDVPDYPKPGIMFKDITPLLGDKVAFETTINEMAGMIPVHLMPTHIVGLESRGFIFGAALAQKLGIGFVPVRKPGKLPRDKYSESYGLEYGTDVMEIHKDALKSGDRVIIVDDVLATGGTAEASVKLVRQCGVEPVALAFLMELKFLYGRGKLGTTPILSLLSY